MQIDGVSTLQPLYDSLVSPSESFMHHSRLCTLVLDCKTDDLSKAATFWSHALGKSIVTLDQDGDGKYAELATEDDEPIILLQRVDHESHVHLDIETDNLEAEVERLEKLGATRVAFVRDRWWVMEAPSGHRFCVVRPQRERFGPHLNRWE
ncbi:hypothetical protein DyAD56_06900 [Dyella sp. AD56]|nr:hypothetical protein DyAD56_06900 [Dyella sp. AD56]